MTLELAEGLLELLPHAVERRMRVCSDHRSDELEGEADRARFQRSQPRREAERVPVELLVDVDGVSVERCVDRVTPAAEVDEVQQLQVLFELVLRNVEALDELRCRDDRARVLSAGGQEVGEQRLQDGEALGNNRARGPLSGAVRLDRRRFTRKRRWRALMKITHRPERLGDLAAQLVWLERDRASVLPQDPRRELGGGRKVRDEDVVLEPARVPVGTVDPPGGVAGELDARLADDVPDLPGRPAAVPVDVEVDRDPEVAFATGCEADVAADA